MKHTWRVVAILGILVAGFILVKSTTPPTFLKAYGFAWVENNSADWASRPMQYQDPTTCSTCHADKFQKWKTSIHTSIGCETCHGPATPHVEAKMKPVVDRSKDLCATCHASLASRPKEFPQIDPSIHTSAGGCITCHNPHSPSMTAKGPSNA